MMAVLNRVIELTGKPICEVWPNLEVFFHGGVAFTPYREQYRRLITNPGMHYMETYNASEGFFGLQDDPADPAMLLMIDYGVFYEFVPLEDVGMPEAQAVPLWEVETGRNYAMVITTTGGLWRYMIGDTVRFTQTDPYKFVITGRTKSFINAFGEELIVDNAERGLQAACAATGAQVKDYTAAPVFMNDRGSCRHQWLIEFDRPPQSLETFAETLDQALHLLLIYSANDAAVMIAENVGGSVENFVQMMNAEAKRLGATGTNFVNTNGLSNDNHYTTAYDMYLIFNEALKYDTFTEIINMANYSTVYHDQNGAEKDITVNSTNMYLQQVQTAPSGVTVIGGKTGTTNAAGHCLIIMVRDTSGRPYVAVIMKSYDEDALYKQMNELLALVPST